MTLFLRTCLLGLAASAAMSATAGDAQSLKQRLATIDSLSAKFEQTVIDINDKIIQQGSGVFSLAYPNKFYWHLTEPDESLIVADGQDVWVYNPFAEEVTVMGLNDAIAASPMALLVNQDEQTWAQYLVSQTQSNANASCYLIEPNLANGGNDVSQTKVNVCFDGDTLTQFAILDEQGNNSQFSLSEQSKLDVESHTLFEFVVPEDVDIDDQRVPVEG